MKYLKPVREAITIMVKVIGLSFFVGFGFALGVFTALGYWVVLL